MNFNFNLTVYKDYIKISKSKNAVNDDKMSDIINTLDNYIIVKASKWFRIITNDEFKEMKFAGYILFDKKYYSIEYINRWLDLSKPFPSIDILNKIIIK